MDVLTDSSTWVWTAYALFSILGASVARWRREESVADRTARLLHLAHALLVGLNGVGHMTAVTIRHDQGLLATTTPMWILYAIGVALVVPSLAIALRACVGSIRAPSVRRQLTVLDGLLIFGFLFAPLSLPLAIHAGLNIAVLRTPRDETRRTIVWISAGLYAAFFIAAFFVSGP